MYSIELTDVVTLGFCFGMGLAIAFSVVMFLFSTIDYLFDAVTEYRKKEKSS